VTDVMKKAATLVLSIMLLAGTVPADEDRASKGVPHLDHVFVIMMENHSYSQIVNNPNAPFANQLAKSANSATNYYAIAHPSLTNYLEMVGGSNFGVLTDNSPDWHNKTCTPNLASGKIATDNPSSPNVCPIWGDGMDAATPLIDTTNETSPPAVTAVVEIDGKLAIPAAKTSGRTIADQLVEHGKSWKSYQENLPARGADGVNNSDGFFISNAEITNAIPGEKQTLINLYAVKHNPFVYFRSVQEGTNPDNSLNNSVGFQARAVSLRTLAQAACRTSRS
jgi:hypothetical protein